MLVSDVMSTDLVFGYVPGTVKEALKILAENNVSGIPLLQKDTKKLMGVVTRNDIFANPSETHLALIMTDDPVLIQKDKPLIEAARLLYKHKIHGLPVVGSRKNLVGVISPADILRALPKEEYDDVVENYYHSSLVPTYKEVPLNVVMEIISVTKQTVLPVLDDDRKVCGVIGEGDLFKLSHIRESVASTGMGMGGDEDAWTWEGIRDTMRLHYSTSEVDIPKVPVSQVMVSDVITAFVKDPISEVAQKMYKNSISHIPVVDSNNYLKGIVSDIDLMACMFHECKKKE